MLFLALTPGRSDDQSKIIHYDLNLDVPGGYGAVLFSEQPTIYVFEVPVGGGPSLEKRPVPDLESLGLQVWLLKADGTTIPRDSQPASITIGNAGGDTDCVIYTFTKLPAGKPVGVVLRVKGKLYCREINVERK